MNDDERRRGVSVRIAGEEHTIRANAEPEYMRSCARYVDERISEIRSKGGLIETHKATILAALSIADELFQAREELEWVRRDVSARAAVLTRRLEEGVGTGQD
jgi:cell division protein ZapA